jgi:hypothetical protein
MRGNLPLPVLLHPHPTGIIINETVEATERVLSGDQAIARIIDLSRDESEQTLHAQETVVIL